MNYFHDMGCVLKELLMVVVIDKVMLCFSGYFVVQL